MELSCSWQVHHFQFEAIRVGEEHCIVIGRMVILARRVRYRATVPFDFRRYLVHLAATVGAEGDFAESHAMPMELVGAKTWLSLLHPNRAGVVVPSATPLGSVFGKRRLVWIADFRQKPAVKALRLV